MQFVAERFLGIVPECLLRSLEVGIKSSSLAGTSWWHRSMTSLWLFHS